MQIKEEGIEIMSDLVVEKQGTILSLTLKSAGAFKCIQ